LIRASQRTGPDVNQKAGEVRGRTRPDWSRYSVQALNDATGDKVSSMEQQQQTQEMIQDLKTLPDALNSMAIDSASAFSFVCRIS
ncbi:hypothetical protein AMECASPLE_037647, partial [Ameca splendens]